MLREQDLPGLEAQAVPGDPAAAGVPADISRRGFFTMPRSAALSDMRLRVREALARTPVTDIHTHVYAPAFGSLLLWGIDELLNHHYLIAETLRWGEVTPAEFWEMGRREQADLVWKTLFLDHSPVSAAAEGLLETLRALGLDVESRDLEAFRAFFAAQTPEAIVDRVFECAGLESLVMTNDPFDDAERSVWEAGPQIDPRFHAALRLDSLILAWDTNFPRLREWDTAWKGRSAAGPSRRFAGSCTTGSTGWSRCT
jgi:hypothetical protein